MNSAKRVLIKLAIFGALAGGVIGGPTAAWATPSDNSDPYSCHGYYFASTMATGWMPLGAFVKAEGWQNAGDLNKDMRYLCNPW